MKRDITFAERRLCHLNDINMTHTEPVRHNNYRRTTTISHGSRLAYCSALLAHSISRGWGHVHGKLVSQATPIAKGVA